MCAFVCSVRVCLCVCASVPVFCMCVSVCVFACLRASSRLRARCACLRARVWTCADMFAYGEAVRVEARARTWALLQQNIPSCNINLSDS